MAEESLELIPVLEVRVHFALPIFLLREPDKLKPVGAPGWDDFFPCAGYLTYPFKNQQGRSWVKHLARDVER